MPPEQKQSHVTSWQRCLDTVRRKHSGGATTSFQLERDPWWLIPRIQTPRLICLRRLQLEIDSPALYHERVDGSNPMQRLGRGRDTVWRYAQHLGRWKRFVGTTDFIEVSGNASFDVHREAKIAWQVARVQAWQAVFHCVLCKARHHWQVICPLTIRPSILGRYWWCQRP